MLPEYVPGSLTLNGAFVGSIALVAGDLLVSIDGGAFAPRGTLPAVTDGQFELQLTAGERAASRVKFVFKDQDGPEFDDKAYTLVDDGENVADSILSRSVASVEATMPEHCLGTIVLAILEWAINSGAGELVIKGTDGVTTRFTKTLTETADDGQVITGVD